LPRHRVSVASSWVETQLETSPKQVVFFSGMKNRKVVSSWCYTVTCSCVPTFWRNVSFIIFDAKVSRVRCG
jgi:hypothetical protein